MATMRTPIESGCPDPFQYMHPLMIKNFGNWKYHDRPRPGVLRHVAHSGDEIWTVRVGTQRQLGPYEINLLCDIIDKFGEGFVRFTIRSNMEIMVTKKEKVDPLMLESSCAACAITRCGWSGCSCSCMERMPGSLGFKSTGRAVSMVSTKTR